MKFTIAVVLLAVAVCSEAGYLPQVVDVSHGAWDSHWDGGHGAWDGHWGAWPAAAAYHPYGPSLTTTYHGHYAGSPYYAPYAYAAHAPAAPGHGHDGKYVAANRGSVHVAPLVGHVQSVSSTNLQPAPGTTW